jgi:hypothetical protein
MEHKTHAAARRVAATAVLLLAARAGADLTATFDADNQGWASVSYPFHSHWPVPPTGGLSWDGANGLPPGSVRIGDVFGETGIAAPPDWLGDRSASYGGALGYDIYLRYTDGVVYPAVILNGGTMSVYFDTPSPLINQWTAMAIPLTEAGWRVSGTTQPATTAQFQFVLANLAGLYLYTEWHTGADDTNVDNVVFTAPPALAPPVVHVERLESGLLRLFWDAVTDPPAALYEVQRGAGWPATVWQPVVQTADTSWTDPQEPAPNGAALYRVLSLSGD